jgi:hypothetical protein
MRGAGPKYDMLPFDLVCAGLRTLCLAYRDLAEAPADWDVCNRLVKI